MPGISYPWCKELSSAALRDPTTIHLAVKNGKRPSLEDLAGFYSRKDHPILNDLARLIEICWKQDPLDRPTASRVLCTVEESMPSKSVRQSPRLSPAKRSFPVSEEKDVTKRLFQDTSLDISSSPSTSKQGTGSPRNTDLNGSSFTNNKLPDNHSLVVNIAAKIKIDQLQTFQWEAINKVIGGQSVLLTSKCGSGKRLCFIIPAIFFHTKEPKFSLVIEPSVALIQEQIENLHEKGIDAIALGSPAGQAVRSFNYKRLLQQDDLPVIAYCTPEYLFGKNGCLRFLEETFQSSLAMVVIDEAHKVIDRKKKLP